jgi:nucleotidyltransferase/DNA polymerase involved in DNA repair
MDELTALPGVGLRIAADLRRLGVRSIKALSRRDAERPEPELLKWWKWKNRRLPSR